MFPFNISMWCIMEEKLERFLNERGIEVENIDIDNNILRIDLIKGEDDFEDLDKDLEDEFDVSGVEWTTDWDRRIRNLELQNSLEKIRNLIRGHKDTNKVLNVLRRNLEIRLSKEEYIEGNGEVVVALSGDLGSMVSMIILKKIGLEVQAVTVDPGSSFLPMVSRNQIRRIVEFTDSSHDFVDIESSKAMKALRKNGFNWHNYLDLIENEVERYADRKGIKTVIFGSFRRYGKKAVEELDTGVRVDLPGLLALSEEYAENLIKVHDRDFIVNEPAPIVKKNLDKRAVDEFYTRKILDKVRKRTLKPINALNKLKKKR